jgi:serine protease inhibitor
MKVKLPQFIYYFHQVVGNTSNNLVMSPLSAQLALAMARAGSRGNTAQQISTALNIQQGNAQPNFAQLLELLQVSVIVHLQKEI